GDSIGDKFFIDDKIKINDTYSINAYSLASYILFEDEFESSNIYFDEKVEVPNRGGYLFTYNNSDNEAKYVMKVKNQSYYKLALDKDGNVLATRNGYEKYRYDEAEDAFYKDEYILVVNPITKEPILDGEGKEQYRLESTKVDSSKVKDIYAEEDVYYYANVVKNPKYTLMGNEYTLDTKGLYVDMSTLTNLNTENISINTTDKIITLTDYSGIDFYYLDQADMGERYFYVDYKEVTEKDGTVKGYIYSNDMSSYVNSNESLSNSNLSGFVSDRYLVNEDGQLQAVSDDFSDDPLTISQMIELRLLQDKLEDLSILEPDESLKIEYTDMIGLIITMVNLLVQIITYSLVTFTALSLVVSTVMIGIITYVSVVERTKEIGIIRSLGGRKKDVSHLFNAETLIIGLSAGILGILITYLLSLIINLIVGSLSGIYTIAALPWYQALIMIAISVFLTMIAGIIPANSAAKKDPVIALRTE
nr:FtsX-like permease family protein [Acholeplasmatales bacterium]